MIERTEIAPRRLRAFAYLRCVIAHVRGVMSKALPVLIMIVALYLAYEYLR
jgi:uncharacterized membrane protein required for colicin V production